MTTVNNDKKASKPLTLWRPLFWEPVTGTGERIMIGIVHDFEGTVSAQRLIRDDVLDCLFGKGSSGLKNLLEHALSLYRTAATEVGVPAVGMSMMGLYPGDLRQTEVRSLVELLHVAVLLYSSLANLDKIDDLDEEDAPQQEDGNRRFSTDVKQEVGEIRPDLLRFFGRSGPLVDGGQKVKFGYFSPKAVLHFSVLNAVRQAAGVRDARARLWELQRARDVSGVTRAALITAIPREDDATLGAKQRDHLKANKLEVESEADSVRMRLYAVSTVHEAVQALIELAD
jgi:hypothetical protein